MGCVWDVLERLAVGDPRAVSWQQGHGAKHRRALMVAPIDFSFVAQLRERPDHVYFGTAYPLGRQRARGAMRKAAGGDLLPLWELPRAARSRAVDNGFAGLRATA
jgi:hypothetical protein